MKISIIGANGTVKAEATAENNVMLVYKAVYEDGDVIVLSTGKEGSVWRKT
jgi:hypothetical protein